VSQAPLLLLVVLLLLVMKGPVHLQGHTQPAVLVVSLCYQLRALLLLLLLLLVAPPMALQIQYQDHCSHQHQVLLLLQIGFLQVQLHHS
jgi:hypothetical protein